MEKILVLCTGNSCRSQMAQGYLQQMVGDIAQVYSAGVETHGVNPKAIATMAEDGIDISHHTSNLYEEYKDIQFDYLITVCDNARERCPRVLSKAKKFHYHFKDPAQATGTEEEIAQVFREVRNLIKRVLEAFIKDYLTKDEQAEETEENASLES